MFLSFSTYILPERNTRFSILPSGYLLYPLLPFFRKLGRPGRRCGRGQDVDIGRQRRSWCRPVRPWILGAYPLRTRDCSLKLVFHPPLKPPFFTFREHVQYRVTVSGYFSDSGRVSTRLVKGRGCGMVLQSSEDTLSSPRRDFVHV